MTAKTWKVTVVWYVTGDASMSGPEVERLAIEQIRQFKADGKSDDVSITLEPHEAAG